MKKSLIFLGIILNSSISYAYCTDSRVEDLNKQFHPKVLLNKDLVDCKKNPDKNETIFVLVQKHSDMDKDGYYAIDADVLTVNDSTNQIVAYTKFPQLWKDEDTNPMGSITIDTARYYLTKNIRAFGISANYSGASHANPSDYSLMSLFIIKKDKIIITLKDQPISSYSGDWDTACTGSFTDTKTVLAMLPTVSNGYFDINLKKMITHTKTKEIKGDCQEIYAKSSYKNSIMQFNGKTYLPAL